MFKGPMILTLLMLAFVFLVTWTAWIAIPILVTLKILEVPELTGTTSYLMIAFCWVIWGLFTTKLKNES